MTLEVTSKYRTSIGLLLIVSFSQSFILIFSTFLTRTGVSSLEQVFFRIVIALPPIYLLARSKGNLNCRNLVHYAPSGCVFAAFLMSGLSSLALGSAIAVTVGLIYTQPLFTTVLAVASGREHVGWKQLIIIIVGVVGAILVSGILNETLSSNRLLGILSSLLGGFWYSLYLFLKRLPRTAMNPLQGIFGTLLFAAPCTLILGMMLRAVTDNPALVQFSSLNIQQLLLLAGLGIISTALPYGTLNQVKTNQVSPTTEGTILLLDPLFHTLWAALFFQQFLYLTQYLGFMLIMASAVLVVKKSLTERATN